MNETPIDEEVGRIRADLYNAGTKCNAGMTYTANPTPEDSGFTDPERERIEFTSS